MNHNHEKHETRREEGGRCSELALGSGSISCGAVPLWQLNAALGSELVPRKSEKFGTLKAGAGRGTCGQGGAQRRTEWSAGSFPWWS